MSEPLCRAIAEALLPQARKAFDDHVGASFEEALIAVIMLVLKESTLAASAN